MPRRPFAAVVSLALATALLLLAPPASAATSAKPYDFNGDGFPELAVGVPNLQVGKVQAGGVVVLPASKKGLSLDEQVITQSSPGVPGAAEKDTTFGDRLTSADFDRDGFADLAIGRDAQGVEANSSITILFGSAQGLTGARSYALDLGDDWLGGLQVADFDGDGWVDLALGLPVADPTVESPKKAQGQVRVYGGSARGFAAARSSVLRGQRQQPDVDLRFGSSLAVGDLDGDGVADLVVGAPGPQGYDDDDEGFQNPGSVSACYGGAQGLTTCTRLVRDFRYAGNTSVAIGNVSGDSRPEVVFGVPDPELIYDGTDDDDEGRVGGAVEILTLSGRGAATTAEVTELSQDSKGVPGSNEYDDDFGETVAVGDLDRDGFADLVIGAPAEDVGKKEDAGRVTVVYGGAKGYRTSGGKIFDQGTRGIPGKPEKADRFGQAVALLDHDDDGRLDLEIGAPQEDSKRVDSEWNDPGAVTTLRGSGKSFTTKGARTFGLKTLRYAQADGSEFFGDVLGR